MIFGGCFTNDPPILVFTVLPSDAMDPPVRPFPGVPAPTPSPGPRPSPPSAPGDEQCFAPHTTHCAAGPFREQWEARGGLPINGFPLSGVFKQRLENGKEYEVQYFERARFEWHPEADQGRGGVLLGQFGRRVLAETAR